MGSKRRAARLGQAHSRVISIFDKYNQTIQVLNYLVRSTFLYDFEAIFINEKVSTFKLNSTYIMPTYHYDVWAWFIAYWYSAGSKFVGFINI